MLLVGVDRESRSRTPSVVQMRIGHRTSFGGSPIRERSTPAATVGAEGMIGGVALRLREFDQVFRRDKGQRRMIGSARYRREVVVAELAPRSVSETRGIVAFCDLSPGWRMSHGATNWPFFSDCAAVFRVVRGGSETVWGQGRGLEESGWGV